MRAATPAPALSWRAHRHQASSQTASEESRRIQAAPTGGPAEAPPSPRRPPSPSGSASSHGSHDPAWTLLDEQAGSPRGSDAGRRPAGAPEGRPEGSRAPGGADGPPQPPAGTWLFALLTTSFGAVVGAAIGLWVGRRLGQTGEGGLRAGALAGATTLMVVEVARAPRRPR